MKQQALLRRQGLQLLHSLEDVLQRIEREAAESRIVIRADKEIHDDLGVANHILSLLECFEPAWLRLAVESVYHRVIADDRPGRWSLACSLVRRWFPVPSLTFMHVSVCVTDDNPGTMIRSFLREHLLGNPELEQQVRR